jgi:Uncharacterized protein conserved in bacteria
MNVTADAARRFLVARQMLAPARSVDGGPDGVLEVFRRLGSIQFDPLSSPGAATIWSSTRGSQGTTPPGAILSTSGRKIFEAYNKGLSLVPTSEFPGSAESWL